MTERRMKAPTDWRRELRRLKAAGRQYVQIVVTRRRRPGHHVRVFPGVTGVVIGETEKGKYMVDVLIETWLTKLEEERA